MAKTQIVFGEVGGGGAELLWQGDGTLPTTITLSKPVTNFTHLVFEFNSGDGNQITYGITAIDNSPLGFYGTFTHPDTTAYVCGRNFTYSGNTITIAQSSLEANLSSGRTWINNTYAIPLKVYGLNIS